jgi:hypothetical protein
MYAIVVTNALQFQVFQLGCAPFGKQNLRKGDIDQFQYFQVWKCEVETKHVGIIIYFIAFNYQNFGI